MGMGKAMLDAPLLPLWDKVPAGRMRGVSAHLQRAPIEPLTRLALRAIHPLPQGERGGSVVVVVTKFPSSVSRWARATFSHKGRREEGVRRYGNA